MGAVLDRLRSWEVDPRVAGMLLALGAIWIALDRASGGLFLTPRNLTNLAVQSSAVGVMATGMVLVIVARHIDLSVGSVLGFTGMLIALVQAELWVGEGPWPWLASLAVGLGVGALVGLWQGWWLAYAGIPAFVVSLAGLLIFRGAAYLVTDGRTVAPLHPHHALLGGGPEGSVGAGWSWALGAAAALGLVAVRLRSRARRRAHGVPLRPAALDASLVALWVVAILGFVAVMNAYTLPGGDVARGIPVPVLVLLVVTAGVGALTRLTRFGRHVFAIGGSPEAAALAGVDVRRVSLGVFVVMGVLSAVAGVLTTARLGAGASSMGTLAELSVIAAAVLGGTSLAGGAGGVGGAVLGAVLIQSLDSGIVLLGVSTPMRQVWIGLVLLVAVWLDTRVRAGVAR